MDVKMKLADFVDDHSDACRAALIAWAMPDFRTTLRDCFTYGRNCAAGPDECWCGKFPREKRDGRDFYDDDDDWTPEE